MPNIDRLNTLTRFLRDNPERHQQGDWMIRPEESVDHLVEGDAGEWVVTDPYAPGLKGCAGFWACVLFADAAPTFGSRATVGYRVTLPDRTLHFAGDLAEKLLGTDCLEEECACGGTMHANIYAHSHTLDDIEAIVRMYEREALDA